MVKKIPVKGGGINAAAKLLAELAPGHSKNLLEKISSLDPDMAETLRENMLDFEDLQNLTVAMLRDLLKLVPLDKMGLALRMGSPKLIKHITENISQGMRREIEIVLTGPPRSVNDVQKAVSEIMQVVCAKVETGEIVLRPDDDETLV